ncbi:glycosyltransferase family 1 protein [Alloacidobacterium dinghuense]|uniref:Glycosyltransferase family 1 protein n=1 Tax=Alloacidobacterium dinghuense TaxID=2763107 RepID=A0A7G8BLT5_9BACT|nr:glycosyltransferase [Alloacidobacterium dinghuense]QNI33505.1 glycosyltransferase family 1 protein [Alloacidobacterium dinghuense]
MQTGQKTSRVLIFSQRNLTSIQPFLCPHVEFEDVIAQVDDVDMLAPRFNPNTRRQRIAKQLAYHTPLRLNPGIESTSIGAKYDLFLAICGNPTDLLRVHAAGDWRSKCRMAVCLIDEMWARQINHYKNYIRMLAEFDLVVLYYSMSIEPLNQHIGNKGLFMPPGVDTLRFCPWPDPPQRAIDVYSIGRRSAVTHHALLGMAKEEDIFYVHDSTSADRVLVPTEHRVLFANLLKRSRYFIVNPGLIDQPAARGNQIEIGNRYFEGAAAGAIMIGVRPNNDVFEKVFNWPEPMIDLPWDSSAVADVIRECDRDSERQETIRRRNVEQALLQHDWLYRWETVLNALGMDLLPKAQARKQRLHSLAEMVRKGVSSYSAPYIVGAK